MNFVKNLVRLYKFFNYYLFFLFFLLLYFVYFILKRVKILHVQIILNKGSAIIDDIESLILPLTLPLTCSSLPESDTPCP